MSVERLTEWRNDGTLDRIDRARRERTPVKIRRSSGAVHDALIATCAGCGGLFCVVAWHPDGLAGTRFRVDIGADKVWPEEGTMVRGFDTADLVELNPWLSGGPL